LAILKRYGNANWIFDTKSLKFIGGYIFILDRVAMSWKSSKKIWTARSIIESRFIAFETVVKEAKLKSLCVTHR